MRKALLVQYVVVFFVISLLLLNNCPVIYNPHTNVLFAGADYETEDLNKLGKPNYDYSTWKH